MKDGVVVYMNGDKVRWFKDGKTASKWAKRHCFGKVEIRPLHDTGRLPRASKAFMPDEEK